MSEFRWRSAGAATALLVTIVLSGAATGTSAPAASYPAAGCNGVEAAPVLAGDRHPRDGAFTTQPLPNGDAVPVIMVHGWTGRSAHNDDRTGAFSQVIDMETVAGAPQPLSPDRATWSLIGAIQESPGTAVYTMDYHADANRWVEDPRIGDRLEAIECLT